MMARGVWREEGGSRAKGYGGVKRWPSGKSLQRIEKGGVQRYSIGKDKREGDCGRGADRGCGEDGITEGERAEDVGRSVRKRVNAEAKQQTQDRAG